MMKEIASEKKDEENKIAEPYKYLIIPSTYTGESRDRKLRTYRIGLIARVAVTFRVNEIIVYYDEDKKFESHGLGRYIVKILKYLITPPYIRKFLFPIDKDLEYVGVCHPLEIPIHQPEKYNLNYKYFYILEKIRGKVLVTDGVKKFWLKINRNIGNRKILLVDLKSRSIVNENKVNLYLGYKVWYFNKRLEELLKLLKKKEVLLIGTSKYGKDIRKIKIEKSNKVAIIFGSPFRGLKEILGKNIDILDYFINFIPNQEVETIRTEEAIYYTFSILRFLNVV